MTIQMLLAMGAVVITVRLTGSLVAKLGQPRVLGEIVGGILLGPSVLGAIWPSALHYLFPPGAIAALQVLAQLGVVLFMFLVGLELDPNLVRGQGRRTVVISQAAILVPVALGAGLGWMLYPRLGGGVGRIDFVLFIGAAMSVTAFPVLARILRETSLVHTRIGAVTLSCAAIGDVTAWCLLAVVVTIVRAVGPAQALLTIALAAAYSVAMFALVRPALARLRRPPLWLVLVVVLLSAWATERIGIHAIFGGFVAGMVMPRESEWRLEIHRRTEPTVSTLLLPAFFVVVGLTTRIGLVNSAYLWGVTALVILVAVVGKFGGATAAALVVGESPARATVIGILMNTRGLTEITMLEVGLQLGVISATVFSIMVMMALATTFMAIPLLRMFALLPKAGDEAGTEADAALSPTAGDRPALATGHPSH